MFGTAERAQLLERTRVVKASRTGFSASYKGQPHGIVCELAPQGQGLHRENHMCAACPRSSTCGYSRAAGICMRILTSITRRYNEDGAFNMWYTHSYTVSHLPPEAYPSRPAAPTSPLQTQHTSRRCSAGCIDSVPLPTTHIQCGHTATVRACGASERAGVMLA